MGNRAYLRREFLSSIQPVVEPAPGAGRPVDQSEITMAHPIVHPPIGFSKNIVQLDRRRPAETAASPSRIPRAALL